jgi:hypothetical protein
LQGNCFQSHIGFQFPETRHELCIFRSHFYFLGLYQRKTLHGLLVFGNYPRSIAKLFSLARFTASGMPLAEPCEQGQQELHQFDKHSRGPLVAFTLEATFASTANALYYLKRKFVVKTQSRNPERTAITIFADIVIFHNRILLACRCNPYGRGTLCAMF